MPKTRITKNGLLAGTYVQPVNVWVHAEQNIPGTQPPANDFSQMSWLTQGVGVDENGDLWGPLDPFPQTGVLIEPPNCGALGRLKFQGDQLNATWVPSGMCTKAPKHTEVILTDNAQIYFLMVQSIRTLRCPHELLLSLFNQWLHHLR